MKHTEAIKSIMKRTGLTQVEVAASLGLRSRATVSMRINRERAWLHNIVEILDVMGYEMVAMPKEDYRSIPEDAYVLRREDYK